MPDNDENYLVHVPKSVSKIDIVLTVLFWVISTWGYVAQYLINDDGGHISEDGKFWIGMTIPMATSLVTLFRSIQLGFEAKSDRAIRRTMIQNNYNVNANSADLDITAYNSNMMSDSYEEEDDDDMPKKPARQMIMKNPSITEIRSRPTVNSAPVVIVSTPQVDINALADAVVNKIMPQPENILMMPNNELPDAPLNDSTNENQTVISTDIEKIIDSTN